MANSILSFLTEGKAPPNVNTTQSLPSYITDYQQKTLAAATGVAGRPYTPYKGDVNANLSGETTKAFDMAKSAIGDWSPDFNKGQGLLGEAASASAFNQANPYLGQAMGINALGQQTPYAQQAGQYGQQATQFSASNAAQGALGQAQAYGAQGAGTDVSGAAQPYFDQAGQRAYQGIENYMNPYQDAVVNRIGELGNRNFMEKLMPSVQDQFIKAGQFGSSRHAGEMGRAIRDTQEGISAAQAQALQQGYQGALTTSQADAARLAQMGQVAGQLTDAEAKNALQAGNLSNQSGQIAGQMQTADANTMLGAGQLSNQIGTGLGQTALGQQRNVGALGEIAGNMTNMDAQMDLNAGKAMTASAAQEQALRYQDVGAMAGIGAQREAETQQDLDWKRQQFDAANNYPANQVNFMADVMKPSAQGQVTTSGPLPGATYGPSGLQQIAGLASAGMGLYNMFKAKGGHIKMPVRKGALSMMKERC
jgi:hypothetical protein